MSCQSPPWHCIGAGLRLPAEETQLPLGSSTRYAGAEQVVPSLRLGFSLPTINSRAPAHPGMPRVDSAGHTAEMVWAPTVGAIYPHVWMGELQHLVLGQHLGKRGLGVVDSSPGTVMFTNI